MGHGVGGGRLATSSPDYYQVLQVDPDAPHEIIVEAYWHLASRLQNSRQERPGLREQLDALNEAYTTLISPEQRKACDATVPRVRRLRQERARAVETASRRAWLSLLGRKRPWRLLAHRCDYYAALCVDPSAESAIVDKAYSVLRLLRGNGLASGVPELEEAHAVLTDPGRRAAYDASLGSHAETEVSVPAAASTPEAPTPAPDLTVLAPKPPAPASRATVAAARTAGRVLWRALATAALLSHRFIVWAWPIVRERSRQFAAWAWPIARKWSRRLAAWAWLVTKALARVAARAARGAVRHALAWWREQWTSAEPIEDWTVLSRLSRDLPQGPRSGSPGERQPPGAVPQPRARLVLTDASGREQILELGPEPITLGAGPSCDVVLEDEGGIVAAQHARIWYGGGRFLLHSLAGTSPTLAGGKPVVWAALEHGDEIQIGSWRMRFGVLQPRPDVPDCLSGRRPD